MQYRGKGIASQMCSELVQLSLNTDPAIIITARTLPEESASTTILKKNGFFLLGTIRDVDDVEVWEWEYEAKLKRLDN